MTESIPPLDWSALDRRAVDTARALAMDAVQRAGNGHPGTAMSLAPAAHLLFQKVIRHDPADPQWPGRDRFVLSAGHTSLTLYVQLYLTGYGLRLEDLQALRQWGSLTPGHPEHGHTAGVETTTGPLGQGLANAVGMAMAARRERGLLDPDAPSGTSPFDHCIWAIASDGDLEEGISHEASAIAGHQQLGNLVVIYDDNQISIEDDTRIAMSEDVAARYAAYGWHVQTVDWRRGPAGKPAASLAPLDRSDPGKPAASLAPLDRSDPGKPAASLAPLDRSDPGKPAASLAPLDRSDPGKPAASLAPLDRSDPGKPAASLAPLDRSDAADGDYHEDVAALHRALLAARAETGRPSLVALRTIIGWPAPTLRNTGKAHGAALGDPEVAATKRILGFDPGRSFAVEDEVLDHTRRALDRGKAARAAWEDRYRMWAVANPTRKALHDRLTDRTLPPGWEDALPTFPPDPAGMATRSASGKVLAALAPVLPELWGGSADLADSNNTTMPGEPSFLPAEHSSARFPGHRYGRTLHFGVREHAMGAILNGIALHGGTRPYGGTFLVFSDYLRPAVRLAALMRLPVIYVWTHDSIGLGEDGPTHQPVEHLSGLRAIPGLDVVRPSDANETVWAWRQALIHTDRPTALCLTRQNVPVLDRDRLAPASEAVRGGYVLAEATGPAPEVILIGTGSEVSLCLAARERLQEQGVPTRVVAMPCQEWFRGQDRAYRDSVLPRSARARVSVEAGVAMSWRDLVGEAGECVSLERFGASAPYQVLFERFGFTPERVVAAALRSLSRVAGAADTAGDTASTEGAWER